MFGPFPQSRFMPCAECGESVERGAPEPHVCDAERQLDFRVFQLHEEMAAFDDQLADWLGSAHGRFASWLAERGRHPSD